MSVLAGNRRFLLVAVPIFVVAIGLVVAYLLLRPTIRRNAATLVESKLEVVVGVVEEVRAVHGSLGAATAERMDAAAPEEMGFQSADHPSDEPLVVSMLATDEVWTGAARADSGACYFVRVLTTGEIERGTIPGEACTATTASAAPAPGWPEL
ncbi:MAG TPA: hypothetical protein VFT27_05015 [Actinomycetota bacterium]|nr:hypothetical protein [Actinomycetota bacterium]